MFHDKIDGNVQPETSGKYSNSLQGNKRTYELGKRKNYQPFTRNELQMLQMCFHWKLWKR